MSTEYFVIFIAESSSAEYEREFDSFESALVFADSITYDHVCSIHDSDGIVHYYNPNIVPKP